MLYCCTVKSFSVPRSVTYRERFQTNLNYYLGNYLALLMLALVVVCISIPSFILCLLFIIAAYYYLFMVRTTPLQLGGRTVRKNELIAAYLSGKSRSTCGCCWMIALLLSQCAACCSRGFVSLASALHSLRCSVVICCFVRHLVSGVLCFLFGGFTVFYAFCWTFLGTSITRHASCCRRCTHACIMFCKLAIVNATFRCFRCNSTHRLTRAVYTVLCVLCVPPCCPPMIVDTCISHRAACLTP